MSNLDALYKCSMFKDVTPEEVSSMLGCLGSHRRTYEKGEYIYCMGDTVTSLGIVLSGGVRIESVDAWGHVTVIGHAGPGETFAETYASLPGEPLMFSVIADSPTEVMFLVVRHMLKPCKHACPHHQRLSLNMHTVLAQKNLALSERIFNVTPKTIRGKVISYLSSVSQKKGSNEFDIPFNRQQLADYLGVDRSALSSELSRMQDEGLIETRRSHFVLHEGS